VDILEGKGKHIFLGSTTGKYRKEFKAEFNKKIRDQIYENLSDIFLHLENSKINRQPFLLQGLKEMYISDCFGLNLKNKILSSIEKTINHSEFNTEELKEIIQEINRAEKTLSGILSGLSFYENRKENASNCCEIILTIPRQQVQENLKNLGQELVSFEKNLSVFFEIATGLREPVRVKTIASSEFSIFLKSAPAIGACIALAVERIIALYKQSLEIKKIKLELEKHKVPDTISALLDNHINSIVSAAAEKIAAELMEKHAARIEANRKNELLIELRHSIENLAEKIDKGFQIEVSVAELGEEKKENIGQLTADEIARKQIAESAKKISYPIASGEPIPALPEKEAGKKE
ncbi:hypothetical protein VU07_04285, partial [Desulfobulbus sp. F4]|nr:hypothetical protein [Desulfobulbus sp. F4]